MVLLIMIRYVLCIMYVCAEPILERLMRSTPPSLVRAWFGTADEFRVRMENRLCGKFMKMGQGRARRGRVEVRAMTPVEIVSAAWLDIVFEATKPADVLAKENNW